VHGTSPYGPHLTFVSTCCSIGCLIFLTWTRPHAIHLLFVAKHFWWCGGQFSMHVEITPRVMLSHTSPKRPIAFPLVGPAPLWVEHGPKESLGSCLESISIRSHLTGSQLNQSWTVSWRLQSVMQRPPPKLLHPPTRRPSEACRSCAGYSWVTWLLRFTDSIMLLDLLHAQNVTTPLLQCRL